MFGLKSIHNFFNTPLRKFERLLIAIIIAVECMLQSTAYLLIRKHQRLTLEIPVMINT